MNNQSRNTRTSTLAVSAVLAASGLVAVGAVPAQASQVQASTTTTPAVSSVAGSSGTACRLGWSSRPKASSPMTTATIRNVRAGRHACFDRLVIDLKGSRTTAGYHVQYVNQVTQDGSGRVVPVRGGAKLQVVVRGPAYDSRARATYQPRRTSSVVNVTGYNTFRQVAWAGSFEGQTTLGLGVRAKLPFRVSTWRSGTSQMVIVDVAHRW